MDSNVNIQVNYLSLRCSCIKLNSTASNWTVKLSCTEKKTESILTLDEVDMRNLFVCLFLCSSLSEQYKLVGKEDYARLVAIFKDNPVITLPTVAKLYEICSDI